MASSFLQNKNVEPLTLINKTCKTKLKENDITLGFILDLYYLAKTENLSVSLCMQSWLDMLLDLPHSNINGHAIECKVYRVLKTLKRQKTLKKKTEILNEKYLIPCNTLSFNDCENKENVAACCDSKVELHICKEQLMKSDKTLEKKESVLQERRTKCTNLSEINKQLKRKLDRRGKYEACKKAKLEINQIDTSQVNCKINNVIKVCDRKIKRSDSKIRSLQNRCLRLKGENRKSKQENKLLVDRIKSDTHQIDKMQRLEEKCNAQELTIKELNQQVLDQSHSIDYLQSLVQDNQELPIYDTVNNKYNSEAVQCVMNITDLKVASEKVGKVIEECALLCGKVPNKLPSATTVNRIVDAKCVIAQKQLTETLIEKSDCTLYTDETKKYGKCIQTYVMTDNDHNSYLIGLREMVDKSGKSTLDTFKEILCDISQYCDGQDKDESVGYQLLKNISNTMSDRAATEKNFNKLLQEYRKEILPQVVHDWDHLNKEEQDIISKMNNFFCGLHLLVGIADSCEESIKKFENMYNGENDIGSAMKPELKRYHRNESGTVRTIRTCCKAFAVGEDEKNGVSINWKTFLQGKYETNQSRSFFTRFKHNRFNLIFYLGQAVYLHKDDIFEFLNSVHGTSNKLLEAVLLDIQEPLYIAGVHVFGVISKFITGPLWRIIEERGHILNMNETYANLIKFLDTVCTDDERAEALLTGTDTPFDTSISDNDNVGVTLTQYDKDSDHISLPLLQNMCQTISQLLTRMLTDHLPGGEFWNATPETRMATTSVLKHNKLPEFMFGQLDQLLRYRPNATLLTNESFLMFSHNKTRAWLKDMDEKKREMLLKDSVKQGQTMRQVFKQRLKDIEAERLLRQNKKQEELRRKESERIRRCENLTDDICFYGLWQSEKQVEEGLEQMSIPEQRKALETQLKFRKTVLKQKHTNKKVYNMSKKNECGKYKKLEIQDLKSQVLDLINDTLRSVTLERKDRDVPLLVGKNIEHKFSDGEIYEGHVISVVPGFPKWYNVQYKNDDAIYAYNLGNDYKKGDVKLAIQRTV